jgi:riboflavin kinase/FMN adenylyltransferase
MQILHGLEGLRQVPAGGSLTIGNFDGLHRGHRRILDVCRAHAGNSGNVAVITFEPHPLTVLRPSAVPPRLTSASFKQELIESLGVNHYVVLPPTPQVLNLTAEDFWNILSREVRPAVLIEGPGFTFGKDRGGDVEKLVMWAKDSAVKFELVEPVTVPLLDLNLVQVSSSLIRWMLGNGRVRDAAICLGRPYILRGNVVTGFGRGRGMGSPTANLHCEGQLIPADGVYAGRCAIGQATYAAAVSIGDNPTFGEGVRQIEAYLLDFEGDLYGQSLDVQLVDWLREQRKFSSVELLKGQIYRDVARTRRRMLMDPSVPIATA